jgi:hypothetical protein
VISAIFFAAAFSQPLQAQKAAPSLPALLEQGYEIKGVSYNIGVLVQKGAKVYVCHWASDNKSSCDQIN